MTDPLDLEPKNGDFVAYVEALQAGKIRELEGIIPHLEAQSAAVQSRRKTNGVSVKDLISAIGRKAKHPGGSKHESAVARMEETSRPQAPVSAAKPKKPDSGAMFASWVFGVFGFMGFAVGIDTQEPPVLMFAAFAMFVAVLMQLKLRTGK